MHDMLVRLYALPPLPPALDAAGRQGISVRRALAPDVPALVGWTQENFPKSAAEVGIACGRMPISCFIAVREGRIVGFACYDATARNFFGPEAVVEAERGRGVGRTLLLAALHAQREQGYAYSIVGGVGPAEFYARTVGAVPIAGSTPGIYAGLLSARPPSG
jgi:GNAT superfamily N-acetyltransferase